MKLRLLCLCLLASFAARAEEIQVFAASSLTDALKEIATAYQKTSGDRVSFNFAASNVLVQQIEAGAPADAFISADEAKMDKLQAGGLLMNDTRRNLLGNSLVIIVPSGSKTVTKPTDLATQAVTHLSLADPKAVPAGIYAKAFLEKAGLWDAVSAKVVPAENVRAAMAVVESGNAEAGIVYKTDAGISKKVAIAVEIPAADTPKILYPAAVVKDSKHAAAARKFLDYLKDTAADEVFKKFGFTVID